MQLKKDFITKLSTYGRPPLSTLTEKFDPKHYENLKRKDSKKLAKTPLDVHDSTRDVADNFAEMIEKLIEENKIKDEEIKSQKKQIGLLTDAIHTVQELSK